MSAICGGFQGSLRGIHTGLICGKCWTSPIRPRPCENFIETTARMLVKKPWQKILAKRFRNHNTNTVILGSRVANTGTVTTADWGGGPTGGGDIDMRVVLDTTTGAGTWTTSWFAKNATDGSYTALGSGNIIDKNITSVGIAKSNTGTSGAISSFSLTSAVPEPSTALLGALAALCLLRRRR